MLEVTSINTYYGLSHVLFDVSLDVAEGEVVFVLGRNGVGKTTTLRSIMGLTPPRSGKITFKGKDIAGMPPHKLAQLGLGYVPEDRRIFPQLTVQENLDVGRKKGTDSGSGWTIEKVFSVFPALERFKNRQGGSLSGGEQQMLTIARTLMGNPDLLILDEPGEGLAPVVVEQLLGQLKELKQQNLTMLISEQNLWFAGELADVVYVIDRGQTQYRGTAAEFEANQEIKNAYLAV
ncbi:MAG: ABC transporter ATP-binding protein [Chloroflexi bacterium]|nr:ABC transporter ATP-binding protein [Chloroflexota bacterium]